MVLPSDDGPDGDNLGEFIQGQKDQLRSQFREGKMKEYLQRSREKKSKEQPLRAEKVDLEDPSFTKEVEEFEADVPEVMVAAEAVKEVMEAEILESLEEA